MTSMAMSHTATRYLSRVRIKYLKKRCLRSTWLHHTGPEVGGQFFLDDVKLGDGRAPEGEEGGGDLEAEDEEGAEHTAHRQHRAAQHAVPSYAEGLEGAQDEEEAEGGGDEGTDQVEGQGQRDGEDEAEGDVEGGEGQTEGASRHQHGAQLVAQRQLLTPGRQEDAPHPPPPLLDKVLQRERALLVHLAIHKAEAVAPLEGHHGEEAVLGDGRLGPVVERHGLLRGGVGHDEGPLPAEERLVENLEGEAERPVVHAHAHAVGQGGEPVDHPPFAVGDDALAEVMAALRHEVDDAHHGVLRQQGLLVQVDDPVVVGEDVHVGLQAVLQGAGLEERAARGAVVGRHHHLPHAARLGQVQGGVRHHLEQEVLQVHVAAHGQVPLQVVAHQLREEAARDDAEAEEGPQERRALQARLGREDAEADDAQEVEDAEEEGGDDQVAEQVQHGGQHVSIPVHGPRLQLRLHREHPEDVADQPEDGDVQPYAADVQQVVARQPAPALLLTCGPVLSVVRF